MYNYGVTCSYDEVLRFKKSAAAALSNDASGLGICSADDTIVQAMIEQSLSRTNDYLHKKHFHDWHEWLQSYQ